MAVDLLYKYRKFDANALRILGSKKLYFAAPRTLNDPLDCQLPVVMILDQVIASAPEGIFKDFLINQRGKQVTNKITGKVELKHKTFETLPETTGVLSLSHNPTDALLWSHYADGHRGFCLGFDETFIRGLVENWRKHDLLGGDDVKYGDAPLKTFHDLWFQKAKDDELIRKSSIEGRDAAREEFDESYIRDMIVTVLTTKSRDWKYEQEYRSVRKEPGTVSFPPSALTEIVFGLRSSEDDQEVVRALLAGPEWKHVHYCRPVSDASTFSLNLVDC